MSKRVPLGGKITKKEQIPKLPASERAKNFLNPIEEKLIGELQEQKFAISHKPRPYLMQIEKQDVELVKLRKIAQKKQKIQNRLEQISMYEKKYEDDINLKKIMRDRNYSTLRAKSELSKEDALKLKNLKQKQRNFQRQLEQKTRKFQQRQLAQKMEKKQLQQRKMQQKNQKKKQEIAKRLEQMAEKRNFRHMRYEEQKKELTKLKVQKKMFQELNEKYEKAQESEKMKKIQEYQRRLKERMVDLNSLKQHEQKYQQVLKQKKQELASKRIQASRLHRSSIQSQHKSKFYTIIMEQQQKARREEFQKRNKNKEVAERMKDYSYLVKRDHVPRIKTKSDEDEGQKQVKQSRVAVDPEEQRKMGLNNLELCKSIAVKNKKNRKINLQDLDKTPQKNRYTDYLSETRKTRQQKSEGHTTRFSKSFKQDVDSVRKIMKQKNFTEVQKVEQIRRLAQKIDSTPQNLSSDGMLNKIAAKIQLLQAIK